MPAIQIEILKPMGRYPKAGKIITTETDSSGVIIDKFLRRRVRDSEHDQCVRIVQESKPLKKSSKEAE